MRKYEITYLTIKEEGHDAATITPVLSENSAKVVSVHPWGARRRLAYPIQKQDQAFYTTVVFEADASAIRPIEEALRLNNDVLRSLVVVYQPGYFDRMNAAPEKPVQKESTEEVKTEAPAEVTEEPKAEAEEAPAKPRKTKKEAPAEEEVALDDKIDALLNEDLTK